MYCPFIEANAEKLVVNMSVPPYDVNGLIQLDTIAEPDVTVACTLSASWESCINPPAGPVGPIDPVDPFTFCISTTERTGPVASPNWVMFVTLFTFREYVCVPWGGVSIVWMQYGLFSFDELLSAISMGVLLVSKSEESFWVDFCR